MSKFKYKDFKIGKYAIKMYTLEDFVKVALKLQTIRFYGDKNDNLGYCKLMNGSRRLQNLTLDECKKDGKKIISIDELDMKGFKSKGQKVISLIEEELNKSEKCKKIMNKYGEKNERE